MLKKRRLFYYILLTFIIADLSYSFLQQYNTPIDGDLALTVVPAEHIKPIFESPLGLKAIKEQGNYPNPNRFFTHWSLHHYFNNIPQALQYFTNPIDSVYLSCAIIKTLTQLLLLYLLAVLISGTTNVFRFDLIVAAALIAPLFQTNGYRSYMGIIDPAMTYTFSYALPLAFLLLFYIPLAMKRLYEQSIAQWLPVIWIPLALICTLSGPLNPGIALISSLLLIGHYLREEFSINVIANLNLLRQKIKTMPREIPLILGPIILFSLYSIYLGTFNINNPDTSLSDLYSRLPKGIYYQFTQKLGFPILFLIIIINTLLIKLKFNGEQGQKILNALKWIGLFSLIYILLLPLGGYREYRPNILRYDTIMPITVALIFIFGKSTIFVLKRSKNLQKYWYSPLIVLTIFLFINADKPEFNKNDCEKNALSTIAASPDSVVHLQDECPVLSWKPFDDAEQSELNARMIRIWGITENVKLYHHRPRQH